MYAALITGTRRLELREFSEPVPDPGGVVVDIALCGICGTDVEAYQSGRRYPPAICGHEWAGTISAVGHDVSDVTEGDFVVISVPPACGRCEPCLAGQSRWCATAWRVAGGRDEQAPPHGGFAPRIAVGASRVVRALSGLTLEQAAQVEPATVTLHAVRDTPPRLGDLAVVLGTGSIGLATLQWARIAGAREVIAVEPDESRRSKALDLGAAAAVAPDSARELVLDYTRGRGADVVYECVGRAATLQSAVTLARPGGRVCLIGLAHGSVPIEPAKWVMKEIELRASVAYTRDDFERSMHMIRQGRIVLEPLHTSTVGLDGLDAAFDALASGATGPVKVLVDPRA
jgi:(R,R)-butanediol dehydrogenase/meso-butanediol dehydrogenase/diacetyl reductase